MKIKRLGSNVQSHQWLHCTARPGALPKVLTHEMCVSTFGNTINFCRSESGTAVAVYAGIAREWWSCDMDSVLEDGVLGSWYKEGMDEPSLKARLWDEAWLLPGAVLQHIYILEGELPPEGVPFTAVPSLHPSRIREAMEAAKTAQQAAFLSALGWD